jgi:hypothetical protein
METNQVLDVKDIFVHQAWAFQKACDKYVPYVKVDIIGKHFLFISALKWSLSGDIPLQRWLFW